MRDVGTPLARWGLLAVVQDFGACLISSGREYNSLARNVIFYEIYQLDGQLTWLVVVTAIPPRRLVLTTWHQHRLDMI